MKSKFLSEKEYGQLLAEKRHYFETAALKDIAYDLLSKYGFNDGDNIPTEIEDIIERRAKELAKALDGICRLRSCVVQTGHSPYYVAFKMGEHYWSYHDLPSEAKSAIDKILEDLK